jgi:hypothetical protein
VANSDCEHVQKVRSASYAGFAIAVAKLSAAVELIVAHRIHFPGAAIQSTFTSLALGSICVAARRLIMRHEPRRGRDNSSFRRRI